MKTEDTESPLDRLRSSFSLKLLLLFLSVFVVIALIGGAIYVQTGAALEDSTQETMEQSTQLQANTAAQWVERVRDETAHVADAPTVRDGSEEDVAAYLAEEREDAPQSVAAIHHFDLDDGTVLASSEDGVDRGAYQGAGIEWVEDGVAYEDGRETALTYPYDDPVTGAPAVAFVSEVDRDEAIVLVVDLEARADQFKLPAASNASFTHVVDDRGTVVMSHHTEDINSQNMGHDDEFGVNSMGVQQGLQGDTGYVEMEMEHGHHGTMAMGFAPVPGTNWVIMTHEPVDEAYALHDDVLTMVSALLVFSLLGLGAVGLVVGRNTTRSVTRLAEQAEELENGNLGTEFESDRVDEIGQLYDSFETMRLSLRDRLRELEEAHEQMSSMNEHLESKADEYSDVMAACAEGDLTRRMSPESESDAMSEIALEFNRMIAELEATNEQLAAFASDVAASSQEVNASAEEVRSASAQVTESIQEIAEGADRQHEYLRETNREMSSLSTATEQIAATSNQVADLAEQTAEVARDGREAAEDAIEGMTEIGEESDSTVEEIEALEEEIQQIDELVEFIEEVAEQTNMLALNASIEASRTDEGDEGFSVVADEVKDLADDTKEATQTIEERIESIKTQTDRTASEVRGTSDRITQHTQAVEETVDALGDITEYADETSDGVQEISAATEQQAASTQEVVSMVQEATAISEETTAETENVAAAGEEQTTSLTEVSHAINSLASHASQLSSELDEFETDAGVEPEFSEEPDVDAADSGGVDGGDQGPPTVGRDPVSKSVAPGESDGPDADDFQGDAPDESIDRD